MTTDTDVPTMVADVASAADLVRRARAIADETRQASRDAWDSLTQAEGVLDAAEQRLLDAIKSNGSAA